MLHKIILINPYNVQINNTNAEKDCIVTDTADIQMLCQANADLLWAYRNKH